MSIKIFGSEINPINLLKGSTATFASAISLTSASTVLLTSAFGCLRILHSSLPMPAKIIINVTVLSGGLLLFFIGTMTPIKLGGKAFEYFKLTKQREAQQLAYRNAQVIKVPVSD